MTVRIDESLEGIDWAQAKADLAADDFDNGRSPEALRRSFERSQHVAIARDGERVVGMARLLSDGVCNAYLVAVSASGPSPSSGRSSSGAGSTTTRIAEPAVEYVFSSTGGSGSSYLIWRLSK